MRHLTAIEKKQYVSGLLAEPELQVLEKHLLECKNCYSEILLMRIALKAKKDTKTANKNSNLSDNTFLDKPLIKERIKKIILKTNIANSHNMSFKEKTMKNISIKKSIILTSSALAAAVLVFVLLGTLSKKEKIIEAKGSPFALITYLVGNITVKDSNNIEKPAKVKMVLKTGDWLISKANSYAIFQIKNYGVFRLFANSKLQIDKNFIKKNKGQLNLTSGKVFSNMFKLKKNQSFRIKTSTAVAAVRGTKFLVSDKMKTPEIFVSHGVVEVSFQSKNLKTNKKLMIKAGEQVGLKKSKVKLKKLNKVQKLQMEKYAVISYQKNFVQKKLKDIQVINKSYKKEEKVLQIKILTAKKEMLNALSPLDRLKAKGMVLTKVYLIDGSQLIGSVVSQDEKNLVLDTGDGQITILKSDIKKREFIK